MATRPLDAREQAMALLEPQAAALHGREVGLADVAEISAAVSLKRIADALTGLTSGNALEGLFGQVTNMAWEAGKSFGHGIELGRKN